MKRAVLFVLGAGAVGVLYCLQYITPALRSAEHIGWWMVVPPALILAYLIAKTAQAVRPEMIPYGDPEEVEVDEWEEVEDDGGVEGGRHGGSGSSRTAGGTEARPRHGESG